MSDVASSRPLGIQGTSWIVAECEKWSWAIEYSLFVPEPRETLYFPLKTTPLASANGKSSDDAQWGHGSLSQLCGPW